MKVTADSIYIQGQGHRTCQDYACHGTVVWNGCHNQLFDNNEGKGQEVSYQYAVLSDGCSSSPNSDIGARLLCHSFARVLAREGMCKELGHHTIWMAHALRIQLGLPEFTLDATLLATVTDGNTIWTMFWGDGFIVQDSFRMAMWYESGAPFYLSYSTNEARKTRYFERFSNSGKQASWIKPEEALLKFTEFSEDILAVNVKDLIPGRPYVFGVMSDGFGTFSCQGNEIPDKDAVERAIAFKTYNGEFVTKRILLFLQGTTKDGWKHFDDLSMAALAIQVEP